MIASFEKSIYFGCGSLYEMGGEIVLSSRGMTLVRCSRQLDDLRALYDITVPTKQDNGIQIDQT